MYITQFNFRDGHRVVITATFDRTIAGKVFGAGSDRASFCEVIALETFHHGRCQDLAKVGVFAKAFCNPSPTWVAGDIHHGCEGPVYSDRCGLQRPDLRGLRQHVGVPSCGLSQGDRKDCFETMNDITAYQQGNAQTTFLHCQFLQMVGFFHVDFIQYRTDPAIYNCLVQTCLIGIDLAHLSNFFGHCHP